MTLPYKFKAICNHCDKHVSWEHAVVVDDPDRPWLARYFHAVCMPSENLSLQVGDQDDDAAPPMDERQSGDSQ